MTNRSYLLALLLATTLSPAAPRCDGDLARLDNEAQSLLWKAQYAEALVGFRQLAACGSARAMKEIGLLYQQGKGVPRDFVQAKSWYEKAIAAGYTDPGWNAYFLIGGLYEEGGPGLARDFVTAQRWYDRRSMRASGVNRPSPLATPVPTFTSPGSMKTAGRASPSTTPQPSNGLTCEACAPPA